MPQVREAVVVGDVDSDEDEATTRMPPPPNPRPSPIPPPPPSVGLLSRTLDRMTTRLLVVRLKEQIW